MKRCPGCQTQYTDDTLQFCLQDGTPLVGAAEADTPTAFLGETETVIGRSGNRLNVPLNDPGSAEWQHSQVAPTAPLQPEKRMSNIPIAVAVTAIGMLILFGIIGAGAWLYLRRAPAEIAKNTANSSTSNSSSLPNAQTSPFGINPSATPFPANTSNSSIPPADHSPSRTEVSLRLDSWKSRAESLNLDAYMNHYAGTVDYYRKPRASLAFVRADKQRAFSRYNSIRVNLSNVSVTIDPSGQTATAVFDKEWNFQGNGNSSGKVKQMMRLSKIDGQWLITAEKDLKVYYVN